MQGRAIEEYYIEVGGFHRKKTPGMENKKHSISLKNKDYEHYQKFARDWLEQRGLLDEHGIPKKSRKKNFRLGISLMAIF